MKRTAIALAVAMASISTAHAIQPSNTFYLGGKLGWSKYHRTTFNDFDHAKNGVGGGIFGGYQVNPYFAFELGYDYLGRTKMDAKMAGKDDYKFDSNGATFSGKLSLPLALISDNLDAYARGGIFINHNKFKGNGYNNSYWTTSPLWGGGIEYQFTDRWSARLDYQWVNHIENNGPSGFAPDNSLLSLGVTYNFGGPNYRGSAVQMKYNEKHYVLNEDIMFPYGEATVTKEGKKALKTLMKALKKVDSAKSHIVIVGHTDRVGSASYNKRLSEQRAQAVKNYFVSEGIPENIISATGVGKSQPVTGNTCNSLSGSALKSCLGPDRRVEIDVRALDVTGPMR